MSTKDTDGQTDLVRYKKKPETVMTTMIRDIRAKYYYCQRQVLVLPSSTPTK